MSSCLEELLKVFKKKTEKCIENIFVDINMYQNSIVALKKYFRDFVIRNVLRIKYFEENLFG